MIYFDNAATTMQKPYKVGEAVKRALTTAAGPGRGLHQGAMRAADILLNGREAVADFFHVPQPENVIFTSNATHALNTALAALLPASGTVLHSSYEHNAVMRRLYAARGVTLQAVDCPFFAPEQTLDNWRAALRQNGVRLAVLCHVSNVFGSIAPVEDIAALCAEQGVPLIVDAAQSAGHVPLDCRALPRAVVCCAGHKGLYGPQGTGLLLVPDGLTLTPLLFGGTGSRSQRHEMPDDLPERLEAGTPNVPGVAGLIEGLAFVKQKGVAAVATHEHKLLKLLLDRLSRVAGVKLYHADDLSNQVGVLSFTVDGLDSESAAEQLAQKGIAVRAGYHCAPLAHQSAGTMDGGTVRVSFSLYNTESQVVQLARAVEGLRRG